MEDLGKQKKAKTDPTPTNKFLIEYRADIRKRKQTKQEWEEENAERKVLYECENVETASYIVEKIRAQM